MLSSDVKRHWLVVNQETLIDGGVVVFLPNFKKYFDAGLISNR